MNSDRIEELQGIHEAEKIRLLLDYEKVRIERFKGWSLAISVFVPLIIAVLTLMYNVQLQEKRAKIDFELKAAEIVMSASSPVAAANKAAVLTELFPDRLSTRFKETLERLYGNPSQ